MKKALYILALMAAISLSSCNVPAEQTSDQSADSDISDVSCSSPVSSSGVSSSESSSDASSSEPAADAVRITSCIGEKEAAEIKWDAFAGADSYNVYWKPAGYDKYTALDAELIDGCQAYPLGLKSGLCDFRVVPVKAGQELTEAAAETDGIDIKPYDRSGYASFGYDESSGLGAYNNDGTAKSDAAVIYVSDLNKNTVSYTASDGKKYVGLVSILQNQRYFGVPLIVRISGSIRTNQFKPKSFEPFSSGENPSDYPERFVNSLEDTYTNLSGLTIRIYGSSKASELNDNPSITYKDVTSYADTDSYFNMCDISYASQVTLEGIGSDAEIFQWGFTWKCCQNIEVRNLTFSSYPEDGCSFQGESGTDGSGVRKETYYGRYWIHNCVFLKGENNWDLTQEQDKKDGDGSSDIKSCHNFTYSYNEFRFCHKTGLIGGSDSQITYNVTFHHNYYYECSSRLPLGRQANIHAYNNYYQQCGVCRDIRANAYVFSEANYFDSCGYPDKITVNKDKGYYPAIKSLNDIYVSCSNKSQATAVILRLAKVYNSCAPIGIDFSSFDTDPSLFYISESTETDNVMTLETASEAKASCLLYCGINA